MLAALNSLKAELQHGRRTNQKTLASAALLFALAAVIVVAQRGPRSGYGGRGYRRGYYEDARTPREITQHGNETPTWTNAPGFEKDVFTFVRVKRERAPYSYGGPWDTDTPDSDLNLSYRLRQVTSIEVDPNGFFLRSTDEELADYPFIYMVEPGSLYLSDEEAVALRNYLVNGGFLMLDDFWGQSEWAGMAGQLKKVFPDRDFVELPLDHPLYRCVFNIKSKDQIPNVYLGTQSEFDPQHRTWERPDATEVHHRAIFDDKGRIMVIATHNTDNGDGWEWEGDNHYYFEHFSEKIAYPLAINIIFYAMTH
ncbi:MAG: transmembrane prediction [Verrucomicrobia bacterium]|nr:MAG: transmembrane prediction [Verrucomicrobiota bacterium]